MKHRDDLAQALDAVLPQTQCGECGYNGCRPYAQAIAQGDVSIDQCPPGGLSVLQQLAAISKVDATPYMAKVAQQKREPALAIIREDECIGCTKCIQACPVDAIVGSGKRMHTVIQQECTGCGLCVEPCPVDCIDMQSLSQHQFDADKARQRFQQRERRLQHHQHKKTQEHKQARQLNRQDAGSNAKEKAMKQDYIMAALARVADKRNTS